MGEFIKELLSKYGYKFLGIILILGILIWLVAHLLAAPGGTVSVFGVAYTKSSGELERLRGESQTKSKEAEGLKALLEKKENQLKEFLSFKEKIVICEEEKKGLQDQNEKQRQIIIDMDRKMKGIQDTHRNQTQEEIKQLQKRCDFQKASLDNNFNKIQELNNTIAVYDAKCIPVEKIIEHKSTIIGNDSTYTVIKEQDKESCAKASALKMEKQVLTDRNSTIQKDIESLEKQTYTLRQQLNP